MTPGRPAYFLVAAALALGALPAPAAGQGCTRVPRADAGDDQQACVLAVGTTDIALSASGSLSQPLNGPIVEHCWTTDYGGFVPTGAATICLADTEVVLRVPNTPGRTIIVVTLEVTDTLGCSDTDDVVLDLATPPVVTRAEAASPLVCLGSPLDLLASVVNTFDVSGLVEYRWDHDISLDSDQDGFPADDGDAVLTGVSGRLVVTSFTPSRPGRRVARLLAVTAGDPCTISADVAYEVLTPPIVRLVVGPATACPNELGRFQAELAFGDTRSDLTWDFDTAVDFDGNGNPADDVEASGQQVTHAWPDSGTHVIRVTALGTNDCEGFEDRSILIKPAPVPAFTTTGPACGLLAVTFVDQSQGLAPLTVTWNFGDGSEVETGTARTHVFPRPGTYAVSHVVTDNQGCITSETRLVNVVPVSARIAGVTVLDGQAGTGTSGNANGFADPGERIRFVVDVSNAGAAESGSLTATLSSTDASGLITITGASASVGVLAAGGSGSTQFPHLEAEISALTPCGSRIPVRISVGAAGAASCTAALDIALRIGAPSLARIGSAVAVTSSPGRAVPADAAFASGAHALVVLDQTSGTPRARLVRYSATGQRLGDDVLLDDALGPVSGPQVAGRDGTGELAAAWIAVEETATTPGRSVARWRRFDAGARPIGVSRRIDSSGFASSIDIAWAADHWVVVWTERPISAAAAQLYAQVITADGLLLGLPVALGAPTMDDGALRIAASGSRVLVAHRSLGELRLYTLEGLRPAAVTAQEIVQAAAGTPAVARFGAGFLIAFESGGGIDLAWLPASGSLSRSTGVAAGASPALATDDELSVLAWDAGTSIAARVIGATGRAAGDAVTVSPGGEIASLPVLSASDGGLVLAAYAAAVGPGVVSTRAVLVGPAAPDGCPTGVAGDVSPSPAGDGRVDIADVVLVLRAAVGLATITPELLERGDVAPGERVGTEHRVIGDNLIDIADAVVLLQASTGLITIVP